LNVKVTKSTQISQRKLQRKLYRTHAVAVVWRFFAHYF